MRSIQPKEIPASELYQYFIGVIGPRPIAFVSSLDHQGRPNLAPFSFFNIFSSNPPVVGFSPTRKGLPGQIQDKDTLSNIKETGELVINVVNYNILRQMAVTSVQFPKGVSEFEKSGLTPLPSQFVKPFRVKESPAHLECTLREIISFGDQPSSGNLVLCDVKCIHIDESVIDDRNRIDPHKIDLMGRLGRAYYSRASGEAVYTVLQPQTPECIGFDKLPGNVKSSKILTGNNLGQLAGIAGIPSALEVQTLKKNLFIQSLLKSDDPIHDLHLHIQKELEKENTEYAARVAWLAQEVEG